MRLPVVILWRKLTEIGTSRSLKTERPAAVFRWHFQYEWTGMNLRGLEVWMVSTPNHDSVGIVQVGMSSLPFSMWMNGNESERLGSVNGDNIQPRFGSGCPSANEQSSVFNMTEREWLWVAYWKCEWLWEWW